MPEIKDSQVAQKYELSYEFTFPPMSKRELVFLKDSFIALSMYAVEEGYSQNVILNLFSQAVEIKRVIKDISREQ